MGFVDTEKILAQRQNFVCCILTCGVICGVVHLISVLSSRVTMLSTAVTISTVDPSSQDGEDTEASTTLNPPQDGCHLAVRAPSCWLLFFKPILAICVGTLLFGSGTTWSLLYFTQVGNVPYLLGPLLLSVGLMFLVTGLIWFPMLKQSLEHHALTKVNHSKGLQVEHRHL